MMPSLLKFYLVPQTKSAMTEPASGMFRKIRMDAVFLR
jgi:hypothetical protein